MFNFDPERPRLSAALFVWDANIILNVAADIVTLILIWYMRGNGSLKINLYVVLVVLMATNQLMYDCSLFLIEPCGVTTQEHECTAFFIFISTCCGIGAAVWALMLIVSVAFVEQYRRQPSRVECIGAVLTVHGFMLGWAVPFGIGGYNAHRDLLRHTSLMVVYNDVRLGIIVVTFSVIMWLYYKMHRATRGTVMSHSPLYHLTRKLVLYPLVQCVCQVGFFTYAKKYNMSFDGYPENGDSMQTFWLYMCVVTAPLAGMGAFLVFIFMKEGAKGQFLRMLSCQCATAFPASRPSDDPQSGTRGVGMTINPRVSELQRLSAMEEEDLEMEIMLWEQHHSHINDEVLEGSTQNRCTPRTEIERNPIHDDI